jgi:hypothetical protein
MPLLLWSPDAGIKIVLDGLESSTITLQRLLNPVLKEFARSLIPRLRESLRVGESGLDAAFCVALWLRFVEYARG